MSAGLYGVFLTLQTYTHSRFFIQPVVKPKKRKATPGAPAVSPHAAALAAHRQADSSSCAPHATGPAKDTCPPPGGSGPNVNTLLPLGQRPSLSSGPPSPPVSGPSSDDGEESNNHEHDESIVVEEHGVNSSSVKRSLLLVP